jgi:hypothetical protein
LTRIILAITNIKDEDIMAVPRNRFFTNVSIVALLKCNLFCLFLLIISFSLFIYMAKRPRRA